MASVEIQDSRRRGVEPKGKPNVTGGGAFDSWRPSFNDFAAGAIPERMRIETLPLDLVQTATSFGST
jgi:hypothetical protein